MKSLPEDAVVSKPMQVDTILRLCEGAEGSLDESRRHQMKIDEFLTDYDFCANYDIHVSASPSVGYERLFWLAFNEVWIVRCLETARTGKLVSTSRLAGSAYFLKARRLVL
jgi:hypothetical protein